MREGRIFITIEGNIGEDGNCFINIYDRSDFQGKGLIAPYSNYGIFNHSGPLEEVKALAKTFVERHLAPKIPKDQIAKAIEDLKNSGLKINLF